MNKVLTHTYKIIYDESNDLVECTYRNNAYVDISLAKEIVENRLILQENKPAHLFIDVIEMGSIDQEARKYLQKEGKELVLRIAIVVKSRFTAWFGNLITNITGSKSNVKTFGEKDSTKARQWLINF